jgi:xylulokinase
LIAQEPAAAPLITGVGLSGNMSSVVLVDGQARPLAPAILLADPRGRRQLDTLDGPTVAGITERTGNGPATVFSLATLLWLRDERPELLAQARAWLSAKDYIRLRLTNLAATDRTDAYNSLLVPAATGSWDWELIAHLGLPRTIFPDVRGSDEVVGSITAEAAAATGLRAGLPVVAGAGDMAALVTGAGAPGPGTLVVSLGTSVTALACRPVDETPRWRPGLTWHPAAERRQSFQLASLLTGGLALNWLRELTGADPHTVAPGPLPVENPLVFLPHLAGAGVPDLRETAHGSLLGLRPSSTAAELVTALYEAIAFELADVLDVLGPDSVQRVVLTGGGSRLPAWCRAIADVLGRSTAVLDQPELSALGAARLGWAGIGGLPPPPSSTGHTLEPEPAGRSAWLARRTRYRRARAASLAYYDSQQRDCDGSSA